MPEIYFVASYQYLAVIKYEDGVIFEGGVGIFLKLMSHQCNAMREILQYSNLTNLTKWLILALFKYSK